MPVQWINRPDSDFRGLSGLVSSGAVGVGDAVRVLPSGKTTTIARIAAFDGDLDTAVAGQAPTLILADQIDCARGDVISHAANPPQVADQFETTIVWMAESPLVPGRAYWLKLARQITSATLRTPKYRINVNSMDHLAAKTLELNEIGVVELATDRPLVFEPYAQSRTLGGFILIDKISNATAAAGMIHFSLRRAQNIHWQPTKITRENRSSLKNQTPKLLWFTGLPASGKSTIANEVEKRLHDMNRHTFLLDGDNLRHGLNRDLGFTEADRVENIRRVGEVSTLMTDAGLIVLAAFISPYRAEREMVRAMMPEGEFVEIYVDTPLEVAEARDPKGLYARARAGTLPNFTGLDGPYEPPRRPEIRINTVETSPEAAAEQIVQWLSGTS